MMNCENLLSFAEDSMYHKKGLCLSDLQRAILTTSLEKERYTYEQLAEDYGYSPKYIQQDAAPKLWQLLSKTFEQKITKSNIKSVLERQIRNSLPVVESSLSFSPSPVSEKGSILLVDDHPQNLTLLSDLLEEQGYEVRQAISGVVALKAIPTTLPDLVLLDIDMPELDGYTVCQKLKANPLTQEIPVIFISAFNEAWDKVKAFSVGGSDYITKPFKTVEVLARVENQLKVRRLQQAFQEKDLQLQQLLQQLEQITTCSDCSKKISELLHQTRKNK